MLPVLTADGGPSGLTPSQGLSAADTVIAADCGEMAEHPHSGRLSYDCKRCTVLSGNGQPPWTSPGGKGRQLLLTYEPGQQEALPVPPSAVASRSQDHGSDIVAKRRTFLATLSE